MHLNGHVRQNCNAGEHTSFERRQMAYVDAEDDEIVIETDGELIFAITRFVRSPTVMLMWGNREERSQMSGMYRRAFTNASGNSVS